MKKSIAVLIFIYFLMLTLNFLMPMSYGDDYFYAFVYENTFWQPLPEDARRLSSFSDVLNSFANHYLTHSGRIIFIVMFFFEWIGKFWFNFVNAGIAVLLILEIAWISDRGRISIPEPSRICWIFFALWTFTTGLSTIFMWLGGSLNYLWTTVMLLGFLIPFVRKYFGIANRNYPPALIFLFGIIAGCTNENTICFFIPFLAIQCILDRSKGRLDRWQTAGVIGLTLGYLILMAAPGNFVRIESEEYFSQLPRDENDPTIAPALPFNIIMLQQSPLWIYLFWNLIRFRKLEREDQNLNHELNFARGLVCVCIFSVLIMFLSPDFPARSMFPGLVYLLIAVTILIRLRHEIDGDQMRYRSIRLLHAAGNLYFAMTLIFTIYGMNQLHDYSERVISTATSANSDEIIEVSNYLPSTKLFWASGMHVPVLIFAYDEKNWINISFARYFGIKGVRAVDK